MTAKIPLADLKAQYQTIREPIDAAIHEVIAASAFIGGSYVKNFEEQFGRFCGAKHTVGVSSGTDALFLALKALGVGTGDEVVTVPMTFIGTTEPISLAGATVKFVDVEPKTLTMDVAKLKAALTPKTRAVILVHLYGQAAELGEIKDLLDARGIALIEDCAQAHGATFKGKHVGTFGAFGCFSFYPGKNLGAYGDAGAVITSDPVLSAKVAQLRDHGRSQKYLHEIEGTNARLDGIQAAVLSVKVQHLAAWNTRRREIAAQYRAQLSDLEPKIELPHEKPDREHVYHQFVLRLANREGLRVALEADGVGTGVHYPVPLHLQPAYASLGLGKGSFPVSESAADSVLSLPMYPEMTDEQVKTVTAKVRKNLAAL